MAEYSRRRISYLRKVTKLMIISALIILIPAATVTPFTIKSANAEYLQMITQLDTPHRINEIVTDSSALYVGGYVSNQSSSPKHDDAFIRKYDLDVNEVWTKQFGTSANDKITSIAFYSSAVFAVGMFNGSHPFLSKHDGSDGDRIWMVQSTSPYENMGLTSVSVDSSGIYVAGTAWGILPGQPSPPATSDSNGFVRKYDLDGNEVWTREFGAGTCCGETGEPDPTDPRDVNGRGLALDSNGVYIVGGVGPDGRVFDAIDDGGDTVADAYVRKYDKDGNYLWTRQFGYGGRDSQAYDAAVESGLLYVTGGIPFGPGFIRVMNPDGGVKQWDRIIGANNYGIAVDSSAVYVAGEIRGYEPPPYDGFAAKVDKDNQAIWYQNIVGDYQSDSKEDAKDIALAGDSVYIVGSADTGLYGLSNGGGDYILRISTDDPIDQTDYNGDGYADLAIGVPSENLNNSTKVNAGIVNVIYGSSSGMSATAARPDQIWKQDSADLEGGSEKDDQFGSSLASGDFNRDGFSDLAIGVPGEAIGPKRAAGAVNIIYGSPSGLSPTAVLPDQFWSQDSPGIEGTAEINDNFGHSLAAGDFNNDGYYDLAIGVPFEDIGAAIDAGGVHVIYGSASGLSTAVMPAQFWEQDKPGVSDDGESGDYFGWSLAVIDRNHDGFEDLAIGAYGEDNEPVIDDGAVYFIFGSLEGLSTTIIPENMIIQKMVDDGSNENGVGYGYSLVVGDFSNRGTPILVIGIPFADVGAAVDAGKVYANGFLSQNSPDIEGTAETNDTFGYSLTVADFNGDFYDDLVIGVPGESIGPTVGGGSINVIYGSRNGLSATVSASTGRADQTWSQNSPDIEDWSEANDRFGSSLAGGDFNNDGRDDLAIGVPLENLGSNADCGGLNVIYGSASGLSTTSKPDQFWSQNSANIEDFGEKGDQFGRALTG